MLRAPVQGLSKCCRIDGPRGWLLPADERRIDAVGIGEARPALLDRERARRDLEGLSARMASIHATAKVHPTAIIEGDVTIGGDTPSRVAQAGEPWDAPLTDVVVIDDVVS